MNKKVYFLLFVLLTVGSTLQMQARELLYYVDVCSFYNQDGKPYLEVYMDVDARSVAYQQTESGAFQGAVEVSIEIERKLAAEGEMAYQRKFELVTGEVRDSAAASNEFGILDIRRISLEPGEYILTGFLKDKFKPEAKQHKFVQELIIEAQPSQLASTSNIEFIQSFRKTETPQPHSKLGYDILPLVTNATFADQDSIRFYMEVYNIGKESEKVYFANAYISRANSTEKAKVTSKVMRKSVRPLDIVTASLSLKGLPSQTYYLNIDLYSQAQDLISTTSKKFFVVNSKVAAVDMTAEAGAFEEYFNLTEEELDKYIHTLYYVSTVTEREFAESLTTFEEKKNYFLNFWDKRRENNATSPAKPWKAYKSRVDYANQRFKSSHLPGWRTARGRVMCIYGPPNDVERNPSSNTKYPYDVWTYYKVKTQANRTFVFYNPNTATDDYTLIHSDVVGEYNNPRWEFEVVRTAFDGNLDNNSTGGRYQR